MTTLSYKETIMASPYSVARTEKKKTESRKEKFKKNLMKLKSKLTVKKQRSISADKLKKMAASECADEMILSRQRVDSEDIDKQADIKVSNPTFVSNSKLCYLKTLSQLQLKGTQVLRQFFRVLCHSILVS